MSQAVASPLVLWGVLHLGASNAQCTQPARTGDLGIAVHWTGGLLSKTGQGHPSRAAGVKVALTEFRWEKKAIPELNNETATPTNGPASYIISHGFQVTNY